MRITFFIFSFFVFMRGLASDNDSSLLLRLVTAKEYNITQRLLIYTEGLAQVSPQLAYRYYEAGKFQPVDKTSNDYINDGLLKKRNWYALVIENTATNQASVVLEYILSGINSVKVYTVNDEQEILPLFKSNAIINKTKGSLLATSETYAINLNGGEKVLLLVQTFNYGQMLYIPTRLFEGQYFMDYSSNRHNFFGIFQGIFFFIILFNLLLYLTTFDKIYMFYMLYAFFISIFALNEVGTAVYSLAFLPVINYFSGLTFLFAGFAIWLLLMLQFLNLSQKNRFLYYSTLAFAALDLLFAFLPNMLSFSGWNKKISFQQFYQLGITVLFAANLFFIIISNAVRILRGSKLAVFYAMANIPVILGTIIYYTNYYNISNISFGWSNPVALGLSMETFLISFGFAYRYKLISDEKQQLLINLNEQQQGLTKQIISSQENERKRIAEDLHDELGSSLAALKMRLQKSSLAEDEMKVILDVVDKASEDTRNISHYLMPPEFEKTPLYSLLSDYYSRINNGSSIRFDFLTSGDNGHFNKEDELIIYRIIMELTSNILRHSHASEATIQMIAYEKNLELMAEDNGKGINKNVYEGIGLRNIQSRVNYLRGEMRIDSNEHGTTFIIQIPYKNN